jgi:molybdopterin-binding protein
MDVSARNRLPGIITDVRIEGLVAQVELKVGDNHVVALITAEACQSLGLKVGDRATALVKATSVMIVSDQGIA